MNKVAKHLQSMQDGLILNDVAEKAESNKSLGLPLTKFEEDSLSILEGIRQLQRQQQSLNIEVQQRQLLLRALDLEQLKQL